jgi:hypothetical protein
MQSTIQAARVSVLQLLVVVAIAAAIIGAYHLGHSSAQGAGVTETANPASVTESQPQRSSTETGSGCPEYVPEKHPFCGSKPGKG